ncbi:MAG TPA: L,D-transpeptidase [Chlamydiales bacterium]|nr:L,D-transpeptidase [Chlamydiales bacterium]
MSAIKYFLVGGFALFTGVGLIGYFKRPPLPESAALATRIEKGVAEGKNVQVVQEIVLPKDPLVLKNSVDQLASIPPVAAADPIQAISPLSETELPEADRIRFLFTTDASKLPIVETVSYTSRVPWVQGRPAWIADYASHYNTSRHFIARSLNKKSDYFSQKISLGDRFNVFKNDINLQFYVVADLSRCRMWLYYLDMDKNERVLLKTYPIGVGRSDPKSPSGCLTPVGTYSLGAKVAIYKSGTVGYFQDAQVEMVRVFGTRWIPFDQEIDGCSEPAKGFGLQGVPWIENPETRELVEDRSRIGKYDSDGCIRLLAEDIEEIYAIVITKPTIIELVKDFMDAKLPGMEKAI